MSSAPAPPSLLLGCPEHDFGGSSLHRDRDLLHELLLPPAGRHKPGSWVGLGHLADEFQRAAVEATVCVQHQRADLHLTLLHQVGVRSFFSASVPSPTASDTMRGGDLLPRAGRRVREVTSPSRVTSGMSSWMSGLRLSSECSPAGSTIGRMHSIQAKCAGLQHCVVTRGDVGAPRVTPHPSCMMPAPRRE